MQKKQIRIWGTLVALLAVWSLVAGFHLVDPIVLPAPWSVLAAFPRMYRDRLPGDIALTLGRVLAALAIASAIGIPAGLFLGYRRRYYQMVEGPLHALRSIPASALFPLFLILVGVGETSIIALAAYPSLLVMMVNSVTGAALANKRRLYQARLFALGPLETVTDILFWEALRNVFDGLRTAVSYSLVLVVAVEMFVGLGERGLGRAIYEYQATYRIPETYAAVMIAGAIGVLLNVLVTFFQNRMLRWLPNVQD